MMLPTELRMEANLSNSPSSFVDQSVVPGDVVLDLSSMANQTIKLGGGLHQDCDAISVMKAGKLRFVKPNKYWVESSQREQTQGMNPELSCTDATGKAAEYGPLKDGFTFESSTGLARMLLSSPTCPVLEGLGKKLSFEIAVGLNGRVWVNAEAPSTVILVSNAIMNSESLSGVQQKIMVEKLLQRVQNCDENMMWLEIHKIEDAPFGCAMTSTFHSQEERDGVKEEVDIY
ncbi:hypothetical protein HYC85_016670 [Camellia sinensis]|uniref:K Homology domain-containing protein n=1 Tax=Camellia sinensis TaxID=4442 RepID=A0A7J7H095_CAMSI|nr:hypothetical protein HYC85_016670 [Camellia sinensis]